MRETAPGDAAPAIFEAAFRTGAQARLGGTDLLLTVHRMGNIHIETGRLLACDPIRLNSAATMPQALPTGDFPVELAVARMKNQHFVAMARIRFSDEAVARWAPAGNVCSPVYTGMALFADSIARRSFADLGDAASDTLQKVTAEQKGALGYIYTFRGHHFAAFSTGRGNGCYATFIGFDRLGRPCRLLTDCDVLKR